VLTTNYYCKILTLVEFGVNAYGALMISNC
jgi:hypothetical protein